MGTHPCDTISDLATTGGRCEDYPCCGHTDGDGCAPLDSHPSAFWAADPHLLCDHETGHCEVEVGEEDEEDRGLLAGARAGVWGSSGGCVRRRVCWHRRG